MLWWTLRQLKSKNPETRKRAAEKLGNSRDVKAIEPLITALEDSDMLETAAEALGKIGDAAIEPLITTLKDSDEWVRIRAARALRKIGDARAVKPLIATLRDSDKRVRGEAAGALGTFGDARAVEPLIATFKDSDKWVRWEAAEALGKIGDAAVEPLIATLMDSDKDVQLRAEGALRKINDGRAVEVIRKIDDERAVEPLSTALNDKITLQRQDIARIFYYDSEEKMNKAYGAIARHLSCYHLERRVVLNRRVLYPYYVVCSARDEEPVYELLKSVGLEAREGEFPFYYGVLDQSSHYPNDTSGGTKSSNEPEGEAMKKCFECGNFYDPNRPACPKCGAKGSMMSMSAEGMLGFLDSLKGQAEARDSVDEGVRLFQQGDLQGARNAYEKAIKLNPNNPVAHSNLGHLLCTMGRLAEGIPHLEKALDLDPRIEGTAEFLEKAKRKLDAAEGSPWWKF